MMTLSDQSMLYTIFSSTHMSWISLHNTWTEMVINTVRVCMYSMYVWHSLHANGIGNMPDNQYFGVPSCWHTKIGPYMTCHSHKWRVWTQTRSVRVQWLASLLHCVLFCVFCFFMQLICSTARPINTRNTNRLASAKVCVGETRWVVRHHCLLTTHTVPSRLITNFAVTVKMASLFIAHNFKTIFLYVSQDC